MFRLVVGVALLTAGCGSPRKEAPAPAPAPTAGASDSVVLSNAPDAFTTPITSADAAIAAPPDASPNAAIADHIELTFAGDIMFGGTFSGKWRPQDAPADFDPLSAIAPQLKSDLALINLETTVVSKIPVDKMVGDLRFAARPDQIATLVRNGVQAVTIANNHANDLDGPGVIETPTHLRELGITMIGSARTEGPTLRVETIEVRGWRIGFIAATEWLNRSQSKSDPKIPRISPQSFVKEVVPLVQAARKDHDLVFVVVHWGIQYVDEPESWQVEAAHAVIDAGADALIGHHPHLLHRLERYKHGLIAYSLGNFLFNNALPLQRNTAVLRLGFTHANHCLDLVALHPAAMYPSPVHHPQPVAPSSRSSNIFDEIVDRMNRLSLKGPHPTKLTVSGDRILAPPACP